MNPETAVIGWTKAVRRLMSHGDRAAADIHGYRRERSRRAAVTTGANVVARVLALTVSLVSIPLIVGTLGAERYGVFAAVTALAGMLAFADLGLSNGALNLLSEAHARRDKKLAASVASSAILVIGGVAIIAGGLIATALAIVPWEGALNISATVSRSEFLAMAIVVFGAFVVSLPLGLIERIRLAHQEGYVSGALAAVAAVATLVAILIAEAVRADLAGFAAAIVIPPVGAMMVNAYWLFTKRPWLRPRMQGFDGTLALRLVRVGGLFVALQLAVAVAFQSDVVVAAAILGPRDAAVYSVTFKVMMVAPTLATLYSTALWPAYTEAIARGDIGWVRQTLLRSATIAGGISAVSSALLIAAGPALIRWWTAGEVEPPLLLLAGAGCWAVLFSVFSTVAVLLNAASVVRFQVIVASVMAIGSISLSALLAHPLGVSGIIWGTVLAYATLAGVPISLHLPRVLQRLDARAGQGT